MIFPMIAIDWLNNALWLLFIGLIDTVCYGLLIVAYNIFYAVAQLDLFGGGTAGTVLYNTITQRLYTVLSIVMVFIFAYQLIMLVIDPDGKGKGAMSQVIKDTLISVILLIVLPLVYRYMAMFQFHVLENGTIPAIILGTNGASSDNPGKNVAGMVLISFFHPNGTSYNTFFDEEGKIKSSAYDDCLAATEAMDGKAHTSTCELYIEAVEEWAEDDGWITAITLKRKKLRHWINDTMSYSVILSSFAAIACAYIFFLYAIDIGVRTVKLGVLQLISPVPVVLRIFPSSKKSFDTWFNHMKKTYLELFIRVAVIFFGLEIVKLIPIFITQIFPQANDSSNAGLFTKCVATVILILGILKFAQEAVPLFKEIFSVGGDLLKGMNLSPKGSVKGRLEDNKTLMYGAGKAMGAWGGFKSQFGRQYRKNLEAATQQDGATHWLNAGIKSLGAGVRGVVTGTKNTKGLEHFDLNSSRQARLSGADAANKQFNESRRLQARSDNQAAYLEEKYNVGKVDSPAHNIGHFFSNNIQRIKANAQADFGAMGEKFEEYQEGKDLYNQRVRGDYLQNQVTSKALSDIVTALSSVKSNTKEKTESITKKINDLQQKLNTMPKVSDPGAKPSQLNMTPEQYTKAMEEYNSKKQKFEEYDALKTALAEAKNEKNNIIAKELKGSDAAKQYAANAINEALDQMNKAPASVFKDFNPKDLTSMRTSLETLSNKAGKGELTGDDIKLLGDHIEKLTNAKVYSGALATQQQNAAQNLNGSSGSSSGSGSSGGSSGSSGGSGGK